MPDKQSCSLIIRQVLRSEFGRRFFGDGSPRWREGRYGNPPKSASWAAQERRLLVNALRREGRREAIAVPRLMSDCELGRPCLSGACPICMGAFQRMFVHATRNLYDDHNRDMLAINIVSANRAIRYGRLHLHDLFRGIRKRLLDALEYLGLPALGGFDVSGNEHEARAFGPHWMPHAWIIAPGRRARQVTAELDEWFPATETVPRPLHRKRFDGDPLGFAYALKPDFARRISLKPRTLEDGNRSTFSTRKKSIWGAERVELALALDRAGLDARLFLHGYELVASRGDVEIVRSSRARERPGAGIERGDDARPPP
jgi:hypothetical protein